MNVIIFSTMCWGTGIREQWPFQQESSGGQSNNKVSERLSLVGVSALWFTQYFEAVGRVSAKASGHKKILCHLWLISKGSLLEEMEKEI